ncbi:MAG: penicillin acylase family protein [Mitsuaria chitosanitabida]|uniref:penicillin acylase family protein n=1 Tax=Roseateles chitosanitabidus TaxID=65048 RepID=UPI001B2F1CCE|nr:penicillin acylase family protein [Roseateles chitosanitabidus]MBO9689793.1 penicillin acylase family protein [Roseateles chitosanitabidus]
MNRTSALRRWTLRGLLALLVLVIALAAAAWGLVRASRPQLDGEIALPGLTAPLSLGRDDRGTLVVEGRTRRDVARGLGFAHAQERFFEMDLVRRSAAGELSALFGEKALERDRTRRVHRLRARLTDRFEQLSGEDRLLLLAYAEGVNAGLHALPVRPWQYLLLRAKPSDWTPVDSLLVISEMYFMLQSGSIEMGFERALLREKAGDAVFAWLSPRGGRWDAALDGSAVSDATMPTPDQLDLRARPAVPGTPVSAPAAGATRAPVAAAPGPARVPTASGAVSEEPTVFGSNNWAVSGSRSTHGGAILANDMHLGLGVPSIWYRAQFQIGSGPGMLRAAGVTLPGLPALVVGSNGTVAWGFTNAYGKWFDWVDVPENAAIKTHQEPIEVKGGATQTLVVVEMDGAPVVTTEGQRRYALHWVAHEGAAYNLELDRMLQVRHVSEALAVAQRAGMPHQNLVAADRDGQIGWTIAGRLWSQPGLAASFGRFTAPTTIRHDWLPTDRAPQVLSPAQGQLWTANNRQLGGDAGELLGDGGFDLGARAQQIRDRLSEKPKHDEDSIGAIHLDDEARFMKTWSARLLAAARTDAGTNPTHRAFVQLLENWHGRADADSAGYRLVRQARLRVLDTLWDAWTAPALGERQADPKRRIRWRNQFEYSAARAVDERPAHLLPPAFASWDALLLAQLDAAARDVAPDGNLGGATWGAANASHIQHVLSKAIPALSRWLDMPSVPQGGDTNLPHVAGPAFGQSERLVVSPGREDRGWLSLPGGQSGHPMSPYYGAGHQDWVEGKRTPLLAGTLVHRITAHRD